MKCVFCGGACTAALDQTVELNVGLPGVQLSGVKVWTCGSCGETYDDIPQLDRLLAYITEVIVTRGHVLSGAEIRFLRKRLGWSQADFAEQFCVDATTVSKWENDKVRPDLFKQKMLGELAMRGPLPRDYRTTEERGDDPPAFRVYVPEFPKPPPKKEQAGSASRRGKAAAQG